jgi:nucleoside-specific outer membrane channel protein Tsx
VSSITETLRIGERVCQVGGLCCLRLMQKLKQFVCLSSLWALCALSAVAQNTEVEVSEESPSTFSKYVLWQDTSFTYLYGKGFEVDSDDQQTLTFEHVSGLSFGDTFLFVDFIDYRHSGGDDNSIYGEFSPRFSVSKIGDVDAGFGPIKDVLVATTYEFGKGDVETFLYGLGFDIDVPGMDYFQLNFYYRDPQNNSSRGWQVTPVFSYTLPVGQSEIVIDGYIDYIFASENSGYKENLHINPQIKYNIGKLLWGEEQRLFIGVEYDYWKNKYGIPDSSHFKTNQSAFSFLLKYHL